MKNLIVFCLLACIVGCMAKPPAAPKKVSATSSDAVDTDAPSTVKRTKPFTLASSEYPSWSTFMVADKLGLIDGKAGATGKLERQYQVDVILKVVDYDKCLELYNGGAVDAVCMTNIDALPIAKVRRSVAICPTSTSVGGDQCIVNGVRDLDDLKNYPIRLLTKSVSEYTVFRCLEKAGKDFRDYKIEHLEPATAAANMQSNTADMKAICVWNPYALNTTKKNKSAKVLFSSKEIPEEIIDMIVVGQDVLDREDGEAFAKCLCKTFYAVNQALTNPATADATLKMLGEDFTDLPVADMRVVLQETKFYYTASDARKLFESSEFPNTMKTVMRVCNALEITTTNPTLFIENALTEINPQFKPELRFTTHYLGE